MKEVAKRIKHVRGKKIWVPVEEQKSLKDLIKMEIIGNLGFDKCEREFLEKIRKVEEKLDETVDVKEKKLIGELVELRREMEYHNLCRFYDAVWDMFYNCNK